MKGSCDVMNLEQCQVMFYAHKKNDDFVAGPS